MTRRGARTGWLAVILLALCACSPAIRESGRESAPLPTGTPHPESGLPVIDVSVATARGAHRFRVEVARSGEEQARGLMFRTAMGADEGMLFPMAPTRFASFWMKNTVIPLDIIFIGPDGRILNIAERAQPYSLDQLLSAAPVKAVLELSGGRAAELGIVPGDRVEW